MLWIVTPCETCTACSEPGTCRAAVLLLGQGGSEGRAERLRAAHPRRARVRRRRLPRAARRHHDDDVRARRARRAAPPGCAARPATLARSPAAQMSSAPVSHRAGCSSLNLVRVMPSPVAPGALACLAPPARRRPPAGGGVCRTRSGREHRARVSGPVRACGAQAWPADAAHLLRDRHRPGHGADRGAVLARPRGPARARGPAPPRTAAPGRPARRTAGAPGG